MAGFGKWYTFSAAVHAGLTPLAIVGMIASVIGAFTIYGLLKLCGLMTQKRILLFYQKSFSFVLVFLHYLFYFTPFWGFGLLN